MLILSRKAGERITIGDDIVVTILEVKGRSVRVGIEAPSHTTIHREEIYQKIQEENRRASMVELADFEQLVNLWGAKAESEGNAGHGD